MNGFLASGLTVSGAHGWLTLIALLAFAAAAVVAVVAPAHKAVHALIASGLALYMLALLWA
ncbi:MAG TPA: hypothetical protein VNH17_06890 [Streptosporangiaceae bacterium]|nr:hypothetical protein [Streptosporangiaceae bacterium]